MSELESAPKVIIDPDNVMVEFDIDGQGQTNDLVIKGTTVDGREAFFLGGKAGLISEKEALKEAKRRLQLLKRDNPSLQLDICRSISPFAPTGSEAIPALFDVLAKMLSQPDQVSEGHNVKKLREWLPIGNRDWSSFWAITRLPSADLNIRALARNKS